MNTECYIYLEVRKNEYDFHSLEPGNMFRPFTEITDLERLRKGVVCVCVSLTNNVQSN